MKYLVIFIPISGIENTETLKTNSDSRINAIIEFIKEEWDYIEPLLSNWRELLKVIESDPDENGVSRYTLDYETFFVIELKD